MKKQTFIQKTDMMLLFRKPTYTVLIKFLSLDHFIYQRRIEIKVWLEESKKMKWNKYKMTKSK